MSKISALLTAMLAVAACAAPATEDALTVGAFLAVDRIEDELKRGRSTKSDVERVLGKPNGRGAAFLAVTDEALAKLIKAGQTGPNDKREMWFYDDQDANLLGSRDGFMQIRLRQQMLMVYFHGDVYDGFMWFSNAGRSRATDPTTTNR